MPDLPERVTVWVCTEARPVEKPCAFRTSLTCFRCGEVGHYRVECYTFRTTMCTMGKSCPDHATGGCDKAHSAIELRRPWQPKCVRVVRERNGIAILGCGSNTHTFRTCPWQHRHGADEGAVDPATSTLCTASDPTRRYDPTMSWADVARVNFRE